MKEEAQCKLTAAVDGLSYTQAAAEGRRTMPLRWNGSAVAFCWSKEAQRDLPAPAADLCYMQAAIEARHTVLFRSMGGAVACDLKEEAQRKLPAAVGDLSYFAGCCWSAPHSAAQARWQPRGLRLERGAQRDLSAPSPT